MSNISRREATELSTMALASLLLPNSIAQAYGTIPAGTNVSVGGRDSRQQMRAAYGRSVTNSDGWRSHSRRLNENIGRVSNYFNSDIVPNEYSRHYANYWREESWWESDHIYRCVCCFLVLRQLSIGTIFEKAFYDRYVGQEKFTWHYEVTWSSRSIHYVVDEWSRLRKLDRHGNMSKGFDGWAYFEEGQYVALDRMGRYARGIDGLQSSDPPDFIYKT